MTAAPSINDIETDYLYCALAPGGVVACASRIMDRIVALTKEGVLGSVDAVVVRGVSGLLVGPMVSAFLDKSLIVVRKDDGAHCKRACEGNRNIGTYIVIDDYVCTGKTIQTIVREVEWFVHTQSLNPIPKLLGVFTYGHGCDTMVRTEREISSEKYVPVYNCSEY